MVKEKNNVCGFNMLFQKSTIVLKKTSIHIIDQNKIFFYKLLLTYVTNLIIIISLNMALSIYIFYTQTHLIT